MTKTVNVHEAKTHLSRLLDDVANGEEVIIAKAGKPWARLVAIGAPTPRRLGFLTGVTLPDEFFFDPLPSDELAEWSGER